MTVTPQNLVNKFIHVDIDENSGRSVNGVIFDETITPQNQVNRLIQVDIGEDIVYITVQSSPRTRGAY